MKVTLYITGTTEEVVDLEFPLYRYSPDNGDRHDAESFSRIAADGSTLTLERTAYAKEEGWRITRTTADTHRAHWGSREYATGTGKHACTAERFAKAVADARLFLDNALESK